MRRSSLLGSRGLARVVSAPGLVFLFSCVNGCAAHFYENGLEEVDRRLEALLLEVGRENPAHDKMMTCTDCGYAIVGRGANVCFFSWRASSHGGGDVSATVHVGARSSSARIKSSSVLLEEYESSVELAYRPLRDADVAFVRMSGGDISSRWSTVHVEVGDISTSRNSVLREVGAICEVAEAVSRGEEAPE